MVIASIIGLAAGLLRWKTGNIYASILFHMFWNLFGR
jgi:membrane protease YdiL (CAAX protease family)